MELGIRLHLVAGCFREEEGGEHLAEREVVRAPAEGDQVGQRLGIAPGSRERVPDEPSDRPSTVRSAWGRAGSS